jgi:hypothetical protein
MPWPLKSFSPTDTLHADDLNAITNGIQTWQGNVNGGGFHLSNVIIDNYFPGAGVPLLSPLHVIPTSTDYSAQLRLDSEAAGNPARWVLIKDATAESGLNAGSDFGIARCNDAGASIDTPIFISRATGVITMGKQKWAGNIDGGGFTLTNVVIPSVFQDPTTTKGDLIVHSGAGGIARLGVAADGMVLQADSTQALGVKWSVSPAVPTTTQVIAGTGLGGGGPLTGNVTLTANVVSVFGRTGAVVLTAADITGATGVINTRQVLAGAGMSGGGTLASDVTLNALVTSVFGRTGAIVLTPADVAAGGGVPNTTKVIAGSGMSGGGALTGDVTLNALVTSVFGRTGAVVLTGADISGAGGVLATRSVLTGGSSGLTGGGPLSADLSLSVVPDTTLQRITFLNNAAAFGNRSALNFIPGTNMAITMLDDPANNRMNVTLNSDGVTTIWHNGSLIGTRPGINLIDGSNVTISPSDNSTSNRVDITISAVGGTGSGAGQTPWTSAIDAASNSLANVSYIGINGSIDVLTRVAISTLTTELGIRVANSSPTGNAAIQVQNDNATSKVQVLSYGSGFGGTLQQTGGLNASVGHLTFSMAGSEAMRIVSAKRVLIGATVDDGANLLQVNGKIKSLTGGIVYPDGTIQTTAAGIGMSDPTLAKGDLIVRSATAPTRIAVGSDGQILMADSTQTLGVKWTAPPSGQTPWLQNVNAAGFNLFSVGALGVGTAAPTYPVDVRGNGAGNSQVHLSVDATDTGGYLTPGGASLNISYGAALVSSVWTAKATAATLWQLQGNQISFYLNTGLTVGTSFTPAGVIALNGSGIQITPLAGTGTRNVSVDLNGQLIAVPYSAIQTPWASDINAAGFALNNVGKVGIGTASVVQRLDVWGTTYGAPATSGSAQDGTARIATNAHGEVLDIGIGGNVAWLQSRNFSAYGSNFSLALNPNGGNVGINTVLPGAPLHVVSAGIGPQVIARFENTDSGATTSEARVAFWEGGGSYQGIGAPYNSSAPALTFSVNTVANTWAERMRITGAGNVGIGLSNPAAPLHVWSAALAAAAGQPVLFLGSTHNASTIGSGASLVFQDAVNSGLCYVRSYIEASGVVGLSFGTWNSNSFERVHITGGGNVGIGTTTATSILDVAQNASPRVNVTFTNTVGYAVGNRMRLRLGPHSGFIGTDLYPYIESVVDVGSFAALAFGVYGGTATEAMRITSAGNVGIGKTNPGYALDVTGDCNISGAYRVNGVAISAGGGAPGGSSGQYQYNNAGAFAAGNAYNLTGTLHGIGTATADSSGAPLQIQSKASFQVAGALKGQVGISGGASDMVTGSASGDLCISNQSAGTHGIVFSGASGTYHANLGSGGNLFLGFSTVQSSSAYTLQLGTDTAAKTASTTWTVASDVRLKRNIRPYEHGLATLQKIEAIRYQFNGKNSLEDGFEGIGVDAKAMQAILPETVSTFPGELDGEPTELYGFNSHALFFVLINAVKELAARIETLETRRN